MTAVDTLHNCAKAPSNRRHFKTAGAAKVLPHYVKVHDSEVSTATFNLKQIQKDFLKKLA